MVMQSTIADDINLYIVIIIFWWQISVRCT